eukprot:760695-Rhodomonas_salina.2
MKLLFIVSRCSRLAYCIHPLDYKVEAKLNRISPLRPGGSASRTLSVDSQVRGRRDSVLRVAAY